MATAIIMMIIIIIIIIMIPAQDPKQQVILGSFWNRFGTILGSVAIWSKEHSEVDYDM